MVRVLVRRGGDQRDAAGVGEVDRARVPRACRCSCRRAEGHDRGAGLDGVVDAAREAVRVDDEAVADAHGQDAAARADARVARSRCSSAAAATAAIPVPWPKSVSSAGSLSATGSPQCAGAEEVVAGDVVGIAVAVVVAAVRERRDQVGGVDEAVPVTVAHARVRGVVACVEARRRRSRRSSSPPREAVARPR